MPLRLRVPDRYAPSLAEFLRLSPEELGDFLRALREERPTFYISTLADSLAAKLALDPSKVREIVDLLASLYINREVLGEEVGDFVAELRAAMETSGKSELQPADWTAFQDAITQALVGDSALAVAAKAAGVMTDHAKVYCHARILTDLRPIFESVAHSPAALVIVHTLKIVHHQEGIHQEFFVAMDRGDIEQLSHLLTRALAKEDALKLLCAEKEIMVLEANP